MKQTTKVFDGKPLVLDLVAQLGPNGRELDRRIRTVRVLNNTPYFIYIGREADLTRETALFVVEPYNDVTMPVSESQQLYALEGPSIGLVPINCRATIMWGPEVTEMAARKLSRNVVIPVLDSFAINAATSTNLQAQGLGTLNPQPGVFAIPASASRRTLYYQSTVSLTSVELRGRPTLNSPVDFLLASDANNTSGLFDLPTSRALPPYLTLKVTPSAAAVVSAHFVVDL